MVFLAGFVDASAGGGGIIAIPAYLFTGMPAHCALGSNKLSSACGTTLSVVKFWRSGAVEPRSAAIAFAASFAGSALGAHIALLLSDAAIKTALLVILPCVALVVLFKRNFGEEGGAREISKRRAALLSLSSACSSAATTAFSAPAPEPSRLSRFLCCSAST